MIGRNGKHPEIESEDQTFTSAQILDEFLKLPDDIWSSTLDEHPSLAGVLREEIERLLEQRRKMIAIVRDVRTRMEEQL